MTEPLKPCPFCGSKAVGMVDDNYSNYWVQCTNCFAQSDAFFTKPDAADAWNARAETGCVNSDAWNDALRSLLQAVSGISKLIKAGYSHDE